MKMLGINITDINGPNHFRLRLEDMLTEPEVRYLEEINKGIYPLENIYNEVLVQKSLNLLPPKIPHIKTVDEINNLNNNPPNFVNNPPNLNNPPNFEVDYLFKQIESNEISETHIITPAFGIRLSLYYNPKEVYLITNSIRNKLYPEARFLYFEKEGLFLEADRIMKLGKPFISKIDYNPRVIKELSLELES
jgi:hypothetical protein